MGRRKPKFVEQSSTVVDAVSGAFSDIEELRQELQDWYDNLPENFQSGDKGQQLEEAIGGLEADSEPDVHESLQDLAVTYQHNANATSRAKRCDNAVAQLTAARDALQAYIDEQGDDEEAELLIDELDSAIGNWEGVEFPGMYG